MQPITFRPAITALILLGAALTFSHAAPRSFRAGTALVDISPTNFPVIVNAMFTERSATNTIDPLHARALVLDDGTNRLALTIVDTCMMPSDLIDRAKTIAHTRTGIPVDSMLVSATHTHSAPAAMGCLGSRADTNYAAFLPAKIAEAIIAAHARLQPARIGWTVVDDWDHTFNRRWIRRPDRLLEDPFGDRNVRAHMHPGHQSPDAIGPSGPVDPALSVIGLQTPDGQPLALFANYSQHYYGSPLLSSDYYGRFALYMTSLLGATNSAFLPIMSQGTSGDLMWMDYGAPARDIGYDTYAREIAERTLAAWRQIKFADWVPLSVATEKLPLNYRVPDPARLQRAQTVVSNLAGRLPQNLPEIYALEATYLHARPQTELILQAIRIGDLGIAALPNEVYALTGLKLKARSPLQPLINIELANGAEGYIPPPEQHHLGGYTTWAARTAGLEVNAEPKIIASLLASLTKLADQPPRPYTVPSSPYQRALLQSQPVAYWPLDDMHGPKALNLAARRPALDASARYEKGVAFYLPGVGSGTGLSPQPALTPSPFSAPESINRAAHFAGGRLAAKLNPGNTYTFECWFWNGLDPSLRPITGTLFSRGTTNAPGDQLTLGGTAHPDGLGKLIFSNGQESLSGRTHIPPKTWHHLALVRDANKVTVYLDGTEEITGEAKNENATETHFWIGGHHDNLANFEGKIDETALYDRPLSQEEIKTHLQAGQP